MSYSCNLLSSSYHQSLGVSSPEKLSSDVSEYTEELNRRLKETESYSPPVSQQCRLTAVVCIPFHSIVFRSVPGNPFTR